MQKMIIGSDARSMLLPYTHTHTRTIHIQYGSTQSHTPHTESVQKQELGSAHAQHTPGIMFE